jgi:hypothetical protein
MTDKEKPFEAKPVQSKEFLEWIDTKLPFVLSRFITTQMAKGNIFNMGEICKTIVKEYLATHSKEEAKGSALAEICNKCGAPKMYRPRRVCKCPD